MDSLPPDAPAGDKEIHIDALIERARTLLRTTNNRVSDVAYDCGFNSKATFNRVFKKLTQSSPTEFLNSIS